MPLICAVVDERLTLRLPPRDSPGELQAAPGRQACAPHRAASRPDAAVAHRPAVDPNP